MVSALDSTALRHARTREHARVLSRSVRHDLVISAIFAFVFTAIAIQQNVMERFILWSSVHSVWFLDELFSAAVISGVAMGLFTVRRWRELQVEVRERIAAEEELHLTEDRLERVFSSSPFPFLVLSLTDDRILACNDEFLAATGHARNAVLGHTPAALHLWGKQDFSTVRARLQSGERIRNEEVEFRNHASLVHPALLSASIIPYDAESAILVALNDISDRRILELRLEHQAFHDALTGLANRALFRIRLEHALVRAPRQGSRPTVLFLDLDDFKRINDSLGHAVGDELLQAVTERLMSALRTEDTCARLGGDEFAILIEDPEDANAGVQLAERLLPLVRAPYELTNTTAHIGVSIGIAVAEPGDTDEVLLRNADLAMYISKTDGRGRCTVFEPAMHQEVADRLALEADMHHALVREEFVVNYQPIVSIETGTILSVEALVRWEHPTRGTLLPSLFIPVAESSGMIVELGTWVLREACFAAHKLQTRFPRPEMLSIAVNLSGRQIADANIVQIVTSILEETQLPATSLILEITESMLVHNHPEVIERLWDLKRLGVRLAIDDFGTGYSSLAYLQRFPVDILKIDKSFTDRIGTAGEESPIARAVMALGNSVSLQTVVEGIETDAQWERLRELGCERGQGFLFAKPGKMTALEALLEAENLAALETQLATH